jgi:hypothetical protein
MPLLRRTDQKPKKQSTPTNRRPGNNALSVAPRPSAPRPRAGRQNSLPGGPPFIQPQLVPAGPVMTASQTTYFTQTTYSIPLPPPANNPHPIYPTPQSYPQQPIQQRPWASAVNLPGAISQTLYDAGDLAYNLHDQWLGGPPLPALPGLQLSLFDTLGLKFNEVITSIDDGTFSGRKHDLSMSHRRSLLEWDASCDYSFN